MNTRRILVADDEPHMARVIEFYLRREGYEVEIVRNGRIALGRILERAPDVLITDINMPEMDGRELCMAIKEQLPERRFPTYVMTSMTDVEHREWSRNLRNTTFLEKPLSMRVLVAQLASYFEHAAPGKEASHA